MAARIDGKHWASVIAEESKEEASALTASLGRKSGLTVILVGDRSDSGTYVRMKSKACEAAGM